MQSAADIENIATKIVTLKRRLEHLEGKLEDPTRRESSKHWDREEVFALRAAIAALRDIEANEDSPYAPRAVLRELVDELLEPMLEAVDEEKALTISLADIRARLLPAMHRAHAATADE